MDRFINSSRLPLAIDQKPLCATVSAAALRRATSINTGSSSRPSAKALISSEKSLKTTRF
ncbi:MAG: hypothetical protein R3E61_04895 [Pseudomonadales bacterium]